MISTSPLPAASTREAVRSARRGYLLWPLLGYFLLFGAWAIAAPYDGTPDEQAHIHNAYAVATGQVLGDLVEVNNTPGVYREVPKSLVRVNCFSFQATQPASCAVPPGGDETRERVLVYIGRYNPAYYMVVGLPIRFSPDMTGVLLGRLVNAAIMAALFGWATFTALLLRHRAAVGGILVALTPITAHLAGGITPNGPEIAAGAALTVALIAIFFDPGEAAARRATWWLAAVSAAALLTLRSGGPAWLAVIVGVMLIPMTPQVRRAVLFTRRFWTVVAALAVVGAAAVGWTLWRHATDLIPGARPSPPMGVMEAMKIEVFDRWTAVTPQLVGILAWLDTPLPSFVYIAWWLAIGSLVLLALAVGRPVDRWRVIGLAALGMLVPSLLEAIEINRIGFINQGRYFLPLLIGVPILSAYVIAERGQADVLNRLIRILAAIVLPLHVFALAWAMIRYQNGMPSPLTAPSLNPLGGAWHPALGSVTPLLLGVASAVLFFIFYWRVTARPTDDSPEIERAAIGRGHVAEAGSGQAIPSRRDELRPDVSRVGMTQVVEGFERPLPTPPS